MTAAVTQGETPVSTGVSSGGPTERGAGGPVSQTATFPAETPITSRDRLQGWLLAAREYVTPPSVLTEKPASVKELAAYAKHGIWSRQEVGALRAAGIAWYRLVGLPVTVVCRYVEWIFQRPGRVTAVAGLIILFWLGR